MKKKVTKPKSTLELINVKAPGAVREIMQANADKYAEGNLSAWLRHAGMMYVPKKGENVPVLRIVSNNFY